MRRARVPISRRGFTVIELVVVVLIVTILLGLVAPAVMSGVRSSRLSAAAAEVASALREARSRAISKGGIFCARFRDTDPPRVRIYALDESQLTSPAWDDDDIVGGVNLPEGTRLSGDYTPPFPPPPPPVFIMFFPDGSAWAPGVTSPPGKVCVVPSAEHVDPRYDVRFEITVRSLTGSIDVSDKLVTRMP